MTTNANQYTNKRAFTEKEASNYIGLSTSTLRQARYYGDRQNHIDTPPFVRLGRAIRYLKEDLDIWLDAHRATPQKASNNNI